MRETVSRACQQAEEEHSVPEFDLTFRSCNSENYSKPITAFVVAPEIVRNDTGLMHFAHGWGGNRYQYREMQRDFAERYNLVSVATEFRMSGYDFDPVRGLGACRPYDAGHYQVIDCLNAMRSVLALYPGIDRERLLAFGGSQGGHITLLMAIFAPDTFALAVSGSGIGRMDSEHLIWAGRDMSPDELAIRDCVRMANRVTCPVILMHGTNDAIVPFQHTRTLEAALRDSGVEVLADYVEGGGHGLEPVTTRHKHTLEIAGGRLAEAHCRNQDAFSMGRRVVIPCPERTCIVDWSLPPDDFRLIHWE